MNKISEDFWVEIEKREKFRNWLWSRVSDKYFDFLWNAAVEKFGTERASDIKEYIKTLKGYAFRYDLKTVSGLGLLDKKTVKSIEKINQTGSDLIIDVLRLRRRWLEDLQEQKISNTDLGFFISGIGIYLSKQLRCVERRDGNFHNIEKVEAAMHQTCKNIEDAWGGFDRDAVDVVMVVATLCMDIFSRDFCQNLEVFLGYRN